MHRHGALLVVLLVAASPAVAMAQTQTGDTTAAPAKARPDSMSAARPETAPQGAAAALVDVKANAFLSVGYTYNTNRPADRVNGYHVFDADANTFNVDVAELVLQKVAAKPGESGFRIDLEVGSSIPEKTQSYGLSVGRSADLQQAILSYVAPVGNGLRLDVGKFVTHLGMEVIEGYDGYNDQYSRSFLFNYAIPFTHTGAKVGYAFGSAVSAMVMVVNGWDNVKDNNARKSVGGQLALTPAPPLTVYLNYIGGAEKTDTNGYFRGVYDVVATWKALPRLTLGVNGDYGVERRASLAQPGADAIWKGIAGYAKVDATSRLALALRAEALKDEGGTRLGVPATVRELTLTPALRLGDRLVARGDLRFDRASEALFPRRGGEARTGQTTVAGNLVWVY